MGISYAYLHNAQRFAEAESAFARGLALMPEEKRCLWDDPSHVLDDNVLGREMGGLACAERLEKAARVWWLAQPLWSQSGNERRTEHYSRWFTAEVARLMSDLANRPAFRTDAVSEPLGQILRFGQYSFGRGFAVGSWWGRMVCDLVDPGGVPVHCTDWEAMHRYFPAKGAATAPFAVDVLDPALAAVPSEYAWIFSAAPMKPIPVGYTPGVLENRREPYMGGALSAPPRRSGASYHSAYGGQHLFLSAQTATLLRGDSNRFLAAFNFREVDWSRSGAYSQRAFEPLLALHSFAAAVVLRTSERDSGVVEARVSSRQAAERFAMNVTANMDSAIVSLEAVSIRNASALPRMSFRHRFAVFSPDLHAAGRIRSSDIVLFDAATDPAVRSESELLRLMLPRSTVFGSTPLGLYWEVYNLAPGEEPEFELTVRARPVPGFFTTLTQSIGLSSRDGTPINKWKGRAVSSADIGTHKETVFTSVVSISTLRPGDYEIAIASSVAGDSAVRVTRTLRVR